MEALDRKQAYQYIKAAREVLARLPQSTASPTTKEGYILEAERLLRGNSLLEALASAANTTSPRTWYRRKASLQHFARERLGQLLVDQDRLQRELRSASDEDPRWEDWGNLTKRLAVLVELVEYLPTGVCPLAKKVPRNSKRKALRGLPADWRERLMTRLHKYRIPFLLAAITGCRPAELAKGIRIWIENDHLIAEISGVKVKELSGQPVRKLEWAIPTGNQLVQSLLAVIQQHPQGDVMHVSIEDPRRFSDAIRAAARREWPRRNASITAYCLRHAAASDNKAELPGHLVSAVLGHASEKTRSYYGQQQMSAKGGVACERVTATRPVKPRSTVQQKNYPDRT